MRFNRRYFTLTILLFVIEILIALFVHDSIIRPYFGDFLVVILMYCFLKSFLDLPVLATACSVLILSYAVEILQFFNLLHMLGLQHSRFAGIILGSSFEWIDLLAYTTGIIVVLCIEKIVTRRNDTKGI